MCKTCRKRRGRGENLPKTEPGYTTCAYEKGYPDAGYVDGYEGHAQIRKYWRGDGRGHRAPSRP